MLQLKEKIERQRKKAVRKKRVANADDAGSSAAA
jgi:hypothetical protein